MRYILFILFSIFIGGLIYFLIYKEILNIDYIYWVPYLWILLYLLCTKAWIINKVKILIAAHFLVLFMGLFSLLLYQLFLQMGPKFSFDDFEKSTQVRNLGFKSETFLYLMFYLGVLVFFIDLVYFIKMRPKTSR